MSTPCRRRGSISRIKTVTSEFMKLRCDPSKNTTSPGFRFSNTEIGQVSRPQRRTSLQMASTDALGAGSMETILVSFPEKTFALSANNVLRPEPTSR
jgi:hypothetical protein